VDQNKRFPMNDVIFRRLQQAIEHPCRSTDWFGMAEQAINTIYALAEKPDQLCDAIIRSLTRRAFGKKDATPTNPPDPGTDDPDRMDEGEEPTPQPEAESTQEGTQGGSIGGDLGDTFELSQLLFTVGHVTIKHIAYLELVERELKRQKGVLEAGGCLLSSAGPTLSNPVHRGKDG
jgi:condensin complex subunit 1